MILEGKNAVLLNRKLMGATNPKEWSQHNKKTIWNSRLIKILCMGQTLKIMLKKR